MASRTNREFLQLAVVHDRAKHRAAGLMMSEKLDGMRAVWVPQARGMKVKDIPFANRNKDTRNHTATGLFSRYGKVIHCPDAFVAGWPPYLLDGELYIGRGQFQPLMSAVKKLDPDWSEWLPVHFHVIDSPTYAQLFADGRINNPQWSHTMKLKESLAALGNPEDRKPMSFELTYNWLKANLPQKDRLILHPQRMLPFNTPLALQMMDETSKAIVDEGGEGLIVRFPGVEWEPIRSSWVFKVKNMLDAEGEVIGIKAGEGKYLGMMGSLTIRWKFGTFELSGFTDEERQLTPAWRESARNCPGFILQTVDGDWPSAFFAKGEVVTFKYRELTDGNHPKEARFSRKRVEL